ERVAAAQDIARGPPGRRDAADLRNDDTEEGRPVEPAMRERVDGSRLAVPAEPRDEQHQELRHPEAAVITDQQRRRPRHVLPATDVAPDVAVVEAREGAVEDADELRVAVAVVAPVHPREAAEVTERPNDVDGAGAPARRPATPEREERPRTSLFRARDHRDGVNVILQRVSSMPGPGE